MLSLLDLARQEGAQPTPGKILRFACCCFSVFLLSSCAKLPYESHHALPPPNTIVSSSMSASDDRININTATKPELETLPGIGGVLAERIIAHREQFGLFRRPEHLIIVRGISERRFRQIYPFIRTE